MVRTGHKTARVTGFGPSARLLLALLAALFVGGGASRTDVQSLIVIRPVAVLVLAWGLYGLKRQHWRQAPFTIALLTAASVLTIMHLIPLPPAVWTALPGRGLIAEIDRASGTGAVWRPLSMVPGATRNALFSLVVPVAVLVLGLRLADRERALLLPVFIAFGLASGLLGALQLVGEPGGPLSLYAQSTTGTANGLFANRNHNGVLLACLFPLLTAFALERSRDRRGGHWVWIAGSLAVATMTLILVVGSRAGLLCAILAILLSPLLALDRLRRASRATRRIAVAAYVGGCAALLVLGGLFMAFARAESLQRLLASDAEGDRRLEVWGPVWDMTKRYFPFGSGIGSYIEVFQINEPREVLSLNYSNHAHNDWLEVAMTVGLAGTLILAAAVIGVALLSWHAWRPSALKDPLLARAATIVLLLLGLASIGDYPLRVPSLMAFCVISLLWLEVRPDRLSNGHVGAARREAKSR